MGCLISNGPPSPRFRVSAESSQRFAPRAGRHYVRLAMKHSVPHDLGPERAKKAADAALASYSQKFAKYDPRVKWATPTRADIAFTVKGMSLKGALEVLPTAIELDLEVPFLLRPFKGQAISVIEGEIKEWIAKASKDEI